VDNDSNVTRPLPFVFILVRREVLQRLEAVQRLATGTGGGST
jgi:hypothetical protein